MIKHHNIKCYKQLSVKRAGVTALWSFFLWCMDDLNFQEKKLRERERGRREVVHMLQCLPSISSLWTQHEQFFSCCFSLESIDLKSKAFASPELVESSFNWPQLWLSSCPLFCYISLIYSVQDRVRDRVPDCLYFPQRPIVVRQYNALVRQNWLTHWRLGS